MRVPASDGENSVKYKGANMIIGMRVVRMRCCSNLAVVRTSWGNLAYNRTHMMKVCVSDLKTQTFLVFGDVRQLVRPENKK
jgi:hypothetical protein